MHVLGLIPARGGSKGIPRKNLRVLGGKPLLQWTIDAALNSQALTSVVVSTEDEEIAAVARACGASIPFVRPADLAGDETPTLPVVQHAIRTLAGRGEHFDAICLLQPTSPLREPADIDACIELLAASGADSVISVLRVPTEYNPQWVYLRNDDGFLSLATGGTNPVPRRQSLPSAFHRDGSIYVSKKRVVMGGDSLYGEKVLGYETSGSAGINIDTPADWMRAEALVRHNGFAAMGTR